MADVVKSLGHFDIKRRVGRDVERLARMGGFPLGAVF
jgi:membrane-associated protease RseP (regulator of RpoE activity)